MHFSFSGHYHFFIRLWDFHGFRKICLFFSLTLGGAFVSMDTSTSTLHTVQYIHENNVVPFLLQDVFANQWLINFYQFELTWTGRRKLV